MFPAAHEALGNYCRQSQESRLKLGVVSQPWIRGGEQSGLQTRITATINPSSCLQMKSGTAFLELESAVRACGD
jgi:hypothetical protein